MNEQEKAAIATLSAASGLARLIENNKKENN